MFSSISEKKRQAFTPAADILRDTDHLEFLSFFTVTAAANEAIATVQKTSSNDKRADQASKSFFI